jgi:cytochrome c
MMEERVMWWVFRFDRMKWLAQGVVLGAFLFCVGCERRPDPAVNQIAVLGGDPDRGAEFIEAYGCDACHTIPGVGGADAVVGPPLTKWALRSYIAGSLPNRPENLVRWIMNPHEIEPGTAMPNLGVSEAEARDIAAYLYTLR